MSELLPNLFPTVRISFGNTYADLPAEMVAPGIAITPCLDGVEGGYTLGGGFCITHIPSGKTFTTGQACIDCARHVAKRIAATGITWTDVDVTDADTLRASCGDQYPLVISAVRLFGRCAQQICFHDEPCSACGMTMQHASYCIEVVGPLAAAAAIQPN